LGGVRIGAKVSIARGVPVGSAVSIACNATIESGATIGSNTVIGEAAEIRQGARVGPRVEIGAGVLVSSNSLLQNCTIGAHSFVEYGVILTGSGDNRVTVGKHCYLGIYGVLDGSGGITIGDFVQIATVQIWTHTSVYQCLAGEELAQSSPRRKTAPVRIESNVWIGAYTVIYPGVTIGHHAVILPNSAIAQDVSSYCMVGGVPARLRRRIVIDDGEPRFVSAESRDQV
jgi:acetyltransferase-like isoleucine patch superfamily enzyme